MDGSFTWSVKWNLYICKWTFCIGNYMYVCVDIILFDVYIHLYIARSIQPEWILDLVRNPILLCGGWGNLICISNYIYISQNASIVWSFLWSLHMIRFIFRGRNTCTNEFTMKIENETKNKAFMFCMSSQWCSIIVLCVFSKIVDGRKHDCYQITCTKSLVQNLYREQCSWFLVCTNDLWPLAAWDHDILTGSDIPTYSHEETPLMPTKWTTSVWNIWEHGVPGWWPGCHKATQDHQGLQPGNLG